MEEYEEAEIESQEDPLAIESERSNKKSLSCIPEVLNEDDSDDDLEP